MWAMIATALIGVWMILAPDALGYADTLAAYLDRVLGPLLTAFATLALFDWLAGLRWICVVMGLAILISPVWYGAEPPSAAASSMIAGLLVVGLSLLERAPRRRYGGGWSALWREEPDSFDLHFR